ncbi:MAG: bifunctional (p)ppGpp synthetase/guanosine-3',5'-bis(diphosphate) 3'-pyrophosphohydrolase [Bacteroidales bacterium]|nr:bifunctional (p)ppGpp synthetase/guanosine-3',5'-bis(diphosphate) 3'-pyrophosphohydrolase [Bacteroidales bacterium]
MSVSKFTIKDYNQIRRAYALLEDEARRRCRNEKELSVVHKAFSFANAAHRHVRRRSGEPYILHPIEVARIVVHDIGLGYKSISAALLHDVVEDTDYTVDDLRNLFGDKIAALVDGLTKMKNVLDNEDRKGGIAQSESLQAENFKRILLTLGDDVRVVLIKLADRLHNCRTIEFMPEHKRDKILSETMFVFIPLAHRLGLYGVKSEMENIWLRYKEPDAYREISQRISRGIAERDQMIDAFIAPIEGALKRSDISFSIKKRIKTPYSVWFKMKTKSIPFEQIYDLYAVRIIFNPSAEDPDVERREAYIIYAIVTGLYKAQPGRNRDWIRSPKSNGYEALHCTLMSHAGIWIEVQIRSKRMDDIAEKGIAAHWAYKRDGYISENDSQMDKWLAKVQEILVSEDVGALELLDIIHRDLVSSEIMVFTPKGEQKSIQNGATVLDFAYLIHTDIGNRAIAAKVNQKLVPLSQVLRAGDQVEIIAAGNGQPKREWLQFLQTRHARGVVIDYFRSRRTEFVESGRSTYGERLRVTGLPDDRETLQRFLDALQLRDPDEFFFRVGLGIIGPEEFRSVTGENRLAEGRRFVVADCCNPIPGDPVVGFRSEDGTVVVHKKSCHIAESLASKYGTRVVIPEWTAPEAEFPVRISLRGIDRKGLLNEISHFISLTLGINMREIRMGSKEDIFEGYIELLVRDKKNLEAMIRGLRHIDGIQDVVRTDI